MNKFLSPRARVVFLVLFVTSLCAYLWETRSSRMSAEKFYRNIELIETKPIRITYPRALVEARVADQSDLLTKCDKADNGDCYFWLVGLEKYFGASERILLPQSYLPWAKSDIQVQQFQLLAFAGKISKGKYREILAEIKKPHPKTFRIRHIAGNPAVGKALAMYYLEEPLAIGIRPTNIKVSFPFGGLVIVIEGKLESIKPITRPYQLGDPETVIKRGLKKIEFEFSE